MKRPKGNYIEIYELTDVEKSNLDDVIFKIQLYYCPSMWGVQVVEGLSLDDNVMGLCSLNEKLIYIDRCILSEWNKLFKTLLHEVIHQVSDSEEHSYEFINELENAVLCFAKWCLRE